MSSLLNSLKNLASGSKYPGEDTNMRFSPSPVPGDSGFNQWRDAMKMVSKLPGGIPPEFRKKLWLALAEKHLQSKGVNWSQTEKLCFNEWSNPDDSELGIQIVKDLHRTGCSLFCGAAGQENQALLKRVLLAYARWNKSVGYCQGFNMLAALILQVMDKNETDSVKVMIYLIEGVLPESYFANNLRGLSVDMIVFRDLLKIRLPLLSKHLEALQNDAREGNSYEPPLTNVFTMQWFLTLFCNCLPQATVLRVWDLIFLEGNEILLRTAIAIWERLSDRILAVNSADEFYSIMGVLTREMLEFGLVDSNTLIKSIVAIGACTELNEMRDKYLYNITPWTQSVQTVAKKGFKLFYSDDDEVESDYDEKAAVTAAYGISIGRKRDKNLQNSKETNIIQPYAHGHPDRERLALDISALKKQYAKLRERQRQAHIILQAACARQPMGQNSTPGPIAMNHLLLGKNAILNSRGRRLGPPKGSIPPARTKEVVKKKQSAPAGETILWKDTEKFRRRQSMSDDTESSETFIPDSDSSSYSEDDASSTSTELCDEENNRLSDFDTEEKNSDVLDDKVANKKSENSDICGEISKFNLEEENNCEEIQSDIKKLISNIDNLKISDDPENTSDVSDLKISELAIDRDGIIRDTDINLESILEMPNTLAENIIEISPKNERLIFEDELEATPEIDITNLNVFINSNPTIGDNLDKITENSLKEETFQNEEDIFEIFLQERVKLSKENSAESLTSPKDLPNLKLPDEKLRRHKSCEETPINHSEKSIFKQKSFDVNALPTIETSLWTPYQIEEEVEEKQTVENTHKKLTKQTSADFLTIEDKRLEAGRRNSERALKIIQENSLILHRILVQQKSSDPDSEEELSRSPISKTFLRSESLLSKDEKTDEERSSKDGEEELESGVESFSVSPALLDEESDKSLKKEFYNENEKLIISKIDENSTKVDTQYEFKYQTSSEKSSFETSLQPNISSLQEGTEIDKNISNVLEICTEANKENMSDKSSNTSDIKNILTFPVSEHNISPLTPDDKKLGASSNNFEVYSVCKNDFKESVNIDTSIPLIPIVKQLDMSPITSEDINISNVLEVTGETHDFENNSSKRSQIQELLIIDSGSTEELQDSKSVNNVFPTSVHYNLSPITPDNKNITNIGETSFETNENTGMFTNSPSPGSKEPYCSYKQYSSLITPEEPNLSNTEATKTFENTELTTSQEQTNFQSISSITSSEQYIFTNITPEDIADKETRILDDESEPKFNQDESSKNFAVLTSKYSSISPITPKDINTLDRISFPSDITIFDDTWKLNIDQKESPDDKFNISTYSSSKQYTFSPITPIYTNALNFILSPSEISQKTELIDPLMEPEVDQNNKNVITNIPIYSSSKKYKISPITPTNAFIPTHNQIDGKSSICDEEFITKKLFEKSSDINTSLFSVSKQFDISPISPEGALKTLDYKNMTFTTQIDNTYYLEEYFDSGNKTTRNITPLDETKAGSSYKFSYKFTDDSPDIETNIFKSDSSETIPNISSITSTNNQEISGLKDSPDYSNYPKSDKLTESSINLSLYEELKDDIQFKMDNTSENFSPYKYKFREDSDESIKQNKTKPQIDSPSVSASKIYSFDSSIESTSQFSTTFMDESTKFKPEDSKFTFKSHLDSPEYYSKSSLSKPELKPVIYSPDDVSPTKTNNNGISVPTIYSPDDIQSTKTKSFDSSLPGKSEDFESISKTPDNNYLSSGQETKYDRTKLSINLDPRRYSNISPEISPPKHLSCLQFTSFQADIPCTSKAIQFSPICTKEKDVSPKSPKSSKYLFNLPTLSPPRRTMKSPLSPNRTFSPFPVQPIARQPKELGVKLGLYRDLNSPNK